MEAEPELFTDYLGVILTKDGTYHIFKPEEENVYEYRGNEYVIEKEKAFRVRGWTPWRKYQPQIPWSVFSESTYDKRRKTGMMIYREPEADMLTKNPITPVVFESTVRMITPKLEKSIVLNPLLRNYRRKQQFQTKGWGILMWGFIGILLIVGILILTGQLHFGG